MSQSPYLLAAARAVLSIFQKIVPIQDQEMHQELDCDVDVNMLHWVSFYDKLFSLALARLLNYQHRQFRCALHALIATCLTSFPHCHTRSSSKLYILSCSASNPMSEAWQSSWQSGLRCCTYSKCWFIIVVKFQSFLTHFQNLDSAWPQQWSSCWTRG